MGIGYRDHLTFMRERIFQPSDWSYFWNALSYNRTRHIDPGDYLLFRPATMGTMAILDIFFRADWLVIGLVSILAHALVVIAFAVLAARIAPTWVASLLALWLSVDYVGSEMILWRHISPYLFGILFFLWGAIAFLDGRRKWAAGFFLLSALFHEITVLVLVGAIVLELMGRRDRRTLLALGIPVLLYGALNLASLLYYLPPQMVFGPRDAGAKEIGLVSLFETGVRFGGISFIALFLPHLVRLEVDSLETTWHFAQLPVEWGIALGLLGLVATAGLGVFWWRHRKEPGRSWVLGLGLVLALTLIVGLVSGRVLQRGWSYVEKSPYYFYWIRIAAALVLVPLIPKKRWAMAITGAAVLTLTVVNFGRLGERTRRYAADSLFLAGPVLETQRYFEDHPDQCFGGTIQNKYLSIFLYRESCTVRETTPLYADIRNPRQWSLVNLGPLQDARLVTNRVSVVEDQMIYQLPHGGWFPVGPVHSVPPVDLKVSRIDGRLLLFGKGDIIGELPL